jgi:inner membrane transporter RhtA
MLTTIQGHPAHLQSRTPAIAIYLNQSLERMQALGNAIPPTFLVLLSCFAVQVGTALAKSLFETLGVLGAAFLLKGMAAALLLCIWRPRWRCHRATDYLIIGLLGLVIALMSMAFYGAVARIPLGVASTLEFLGPLGVAIAGSRRGLDFLWVLLAGLGVFLLSPITNNLHLDPIGIALALFSALCWGSYILLSRQAGRAFPGGAGLSLAMLFTAGCLLPFGVADAGVALLSWKVWLVGLGIACIGTLLPFSLEYSALKRLPPRIFGVLMSIEPAIAALVGFLVLGEHLTLQTVLAICLVTTAAMGVTLLGRHDPGH